MANCTSCGGYLRDPFDLSSTFSTSCSCNTGGLIVEGESSQSTPSECCVESVNGKNGVINLTTTDIPEGDNLYFTETRARESLDADSPILYDSVNGIISHDVSGIAPGTYGGPSDFPVITVDEFGHITAVTEQSVSGGGGGGSIGPDLTAIEALTGTGYLVRTAVNTWTLRSLSAASSRIALTQPDGVAGPTVIDLALSGVVAGSYGNTVSYPKITVDGYGRITSVSTQAIPTPTLPPHTHTIGNLSNVDDDVDSTALVGQAITWDGSQYVAAYPKPKYDDYEISLQTPWVVATGNDDQDIVEENVPINLIRVTEGLEDKKVVHINAVLYAIATEVEDIVTINSTAHTTYTSLVSITYVRCLLGRVPTEAWPTHNMEFPLAAYVQGDQYWNQDHSIQFERAQFFSNMTLSIDTNGFLYVTIGMIGDIQSSMVSLSSVSHLIVPISVTYPSKVIEL